MKFEHQDKKIELKDLVPDFERAIKLFKKEGVYAHTSVLAYILVLMYHINETKDRMAAKWVLSELENLRNFRKFEPYLLLKSFVAVWDGDYDSKLLLESFSTFDDSNLDLFNELLILLMSRHQYHFLFNQFENNPKLRALLKPTYYALMTLMEDEMPNEIVRMGDELKVPVEEILEKVERMKVDYKVV